MSWALMGAAAIGAGGSYLSSREANKNEGFKQIPLTENQKKAEQYLGGLLEGKEVFEPRKIAEFPPAVQEAIATVDRIMKGGIPEIDQAIKVTADRMMAPPETVPGLEGLFTKTRELGADLLGRTQRGLAMTGNLPSESSAGEEIYGRTLQDIIEGLVTAAYPYYSQGLEAKYRAPMELAALGTQKVTTPLSLATTVGRLPMEREQSIFDAILEAKRKTKEFPYQAQAPIASSLLGEQMYAYNPGQQQPSNFSQIAQPLAMLGSAAIMKGGSGGQQTVGQQFENMRNPYYYGN